MVMYVCNKACLIQPSTKLSSLIHSVCHGVKLITNSAITTKRSMGKHLLGECAGMCGMSVTITVGRRRLPACENLTY